MSRHLSARVQSFIADRSTADWRIGQDVAEEFKPCIRETKQKIRKWEREHNIPACNSKNRTLRLYQKWKAGQLPPESVPAVLRDHGKEFKRFEKQGL